MPVIVPPPILIVPPPPPVVFAPPIAAGVAAAAAIIAGGLVVAAAIDARKAQEEADRNIRKLKEPNYGPKPRFREEQIPPGQQFVPYGVIASAEYTGGNSDGVYYFNRGNRSGSTNLAIIKEQTTNLFPIQGKITAVSPPVNQNGSWRLLIDTIDSNGNQGGWSIAVADSQNFSSSLVPSSLKIHEIYRIDGQPDGGRTTTKVGESYTPTPDRIGTGTGNPETDRRNAPPPPFDLSKLNIGSKIGSAVGSGGGITNNVTNNISSFSSSIGSLNIGAALGFGASPTVAPPQPTPKPPEPTPKPPDPKEQERKKEEERKKKEEEERKVGFPPPSSDVSRLNNEIAALRNALNSQNGQFAQLGAILATVAANTTPEQQKANAKQATCETLQSDPCTAKLKNDIKDPILGKLDAAQTARDANAAAQSAALAAITAEQQIQKGTLASILAKAGDIFNKIGDLWNNGMVQKAMNYITMITVIHNAFMLSNSIVDTLGSAIDQGIQALGLKIKDKDGNDQGVTQIIGKSVQDLIKSVIGQANYTALTETWAKANRIYQAGVNLLSNVQSIIDSSTAIAELSSNRLANLMNALRETGMVREDAYRSQSLPTTRFNAFLNKMEAFEQGTSNLAAITGNIVSVQQSVNELKSNRDALDAAVFDKDIQAETAKTEKREVSVFTINDFSITRAESENE